MAFIMSRICHVKRILITLCMVCFVNLCHALKTEKFPLLMPNVRPTLPETYFCTPIRIDSEKDYYIVGFEPNATMAIAHHMLLYGCTTPGNEEPYWNCGEMSTITRPDIKTASPCREGSQVIYAWARDAPALKLPKDVGFRVGGDTPIQYLVLQVHYGHTEYFQDGGTDDSGVFLVYTEVPQSKTAGVLLLGTAGIIPPKSVEFMETACTLKEEKVIHPFAFRTHTHSLGRVVSGFRVRRDSSGIDNWKLIGKRDPLLPQMFYPISKNITAEFGDTLAARCTMESDRDRITKIGSTNEDEMCNFYLMYYVDGPEPLDTKYCFSMGPPIFTWDSFPLNHIPTVEEASSLL